VPLRHLPAGRPDAARAGGAGTGAGAMSEGKFDPSKHLSNKVRGGAEYLEVKWRLVWLRSEHPDAAIATELVRETDDSALFKASVNIPGGGSERPAAVPSAAGPPSQMTVEEKAEAAREFFGKVRTGNAALGAAERLIGDAVPPKLWTAEFSRACDRLGVQPGERAGVNAKLNERAAVPA
jgi:hypothetical protein